MLSVRIQFVMLTMFVGRWYVCATESREFPVTSGKVPATIHIRLRRKKPLNILRHKLVYGNGQPLFALIQFAAGLQRLIPLATNPSSKEDIQLFLRGLRSGH